MKIKNYKLAIVWLLLFVPKIAAAQTAIKDAQDKLKDAADAAHLITDPSKVDAYTVAANWINGFIGVFMMFATYFIITAGFQWMTSGGNADKVLAAKTTFKNTLLGVIIALTAYVLVRAIMLALGGSTGLVTAPSIP